MNYLALIGGLMILVLSAAAMLGGLGQDVALWGIVVGALLVVVGLVFRIVAVRKHD